MKRSLSDSDSESLFDDHDGHKSSSPSQSCHVTDRKRRRGVIEKRRRDRINNSLSELRRLVPSAFEKQGSAKLEKAEILQMTVDHLKVLHTKTNGYNYHEPHTLAIDYRGIGYRECAAEVARYLVAVEGMDLQDPLRLRLLSHLQCFSAQREVVAKATTLQNNSWNSMSTMSTHNQHNQYVTGSGMSSMGSMLASHNTNQSDMNINGHTTQSGLVPTSYSDARVSQPDISSSLHSSGMRLPTSVNMPSIHGQMSNMNNSGGQSPPLIPQLHGQFSMPLNTMQSIMAQNQQGYNNGSSVKPYRPWGSELAY